MVAGSLFTLYCFGISYLVYDVTKVTVTEFVPTPRSRSDKLWLYPFLCGVGAYYIFVSVCIVAVWQHII